MPLTTLKVPFEDRYKHLIRKIPYNHTFIVSLLFIMFLCYLVSSFDIPYIATFRVLCIGETHARAFVDEVIQKGGGEGLIFRRVASHYELGRSLSLLKLKVMVFCCPIFFSPSFNVM